MMACPWPEEGGGGGGRVFFPHRPKIKGPSGATPSRAPKELVDVFSLGYSLVQGIVGLVEDLQQDVLAERLEPFGIVHHPAGGLPGVLQEAAG